MRGILKERTRQSEPPFGDKSGAFAKGKEKRGNTAYIWEARAGVLKLEDFGVSNTPGDSGKTAVVKAASLDAMTLVYFNPALMPYGKIRNGYAIPQARE